jgi:hypothetical protein
MYFPEDQAKLFKLLVRVLYYIFSGCSKVGYLAADDWNKYYGNQYAINVHKLSYALTLRNHESMNALSSNRNPRKKKI